MRRDGRGAASPPLLCRPDPESGQIRARNHVWSLDRCRDASVSASAASVQRCAVSPEAKAASAHSAAAAASGVQLTQASSASQCAAVCARVLPPVPADAQTLTVSLKKEKDAKPGGGRRNVLSSQVKRFRAVGLRRDLFRE